MLILEYRSILKTLMQGKCVDKPRRLFKIITKAVISVGYKLKLQISGDHVDVTPGVGVYVTTAVLYY